MKKIMLLHTGGTISMAEDEFGSVGQQTEHPLANLAANLGMAARIEEEVLFNLPSPQIEPEHVLEIANLIRHSDADAFVITHGTDTLEESAYLLDLITPAGKPIVMTGAMRSSNELGSDAAANLSAALLTAVHGTQTDMGVIVVLNGEIHGAKEVYKKSSINLASFKSANGPLGLITKNGPVYVRQVQKKVSLTVQSLNSRVFLLKAYEGMDGELIEAVSHLHPDGIVIEAFGQGNLPKKAMPALQRTIEMNIPIIIVSRCVESVVQPTYDYQGGGKQLKDLGAIQVSGLSGPKPRLKLLAVLNIAKSQQEIEEYMIQS